jgi:hypothetical protein
MRWHRFHLQIAALVVKHMAKSRHRDRIIIRPFAGAILASSTFPAPANSSSFLQLD